ncbi:MAG: MGMT family protein, partial [Flavobacteriaceae bacterium]|nr:MGMT family protein [Flavobacteriaceae bacterium]
ANNKEMITPYWRVLKPDGAINIKFPGGAEKQVEFLQSEGHNIEFGKGKKPPKVIDFHKKLYSFK